MVLHAVGLRRHRRIDLGVAHAHAGLRIALPQALDRDFVAQGIAEIGEIDAVVGEVRAQLVQGHVVLAGDVAEGRVDVLVADPDALLRGLGDLQADQDQAFQHLFAQDVGRRQLAVRLLPVLRQHVAGGAVEFALQHHIVVDHGDDAIDGLRGLRERISGEQAGGEQAGEQCLHGRESGRSSSEASLSTLTEAGGIR